MCVSVKPKGEENAKMAKIQSDLSDESIKEFKEVSLSFNQPHYATAATTSRFTFMYNGNPSENGRVKNGERTKKEKEKKQKAKNP